jgi:Catalytic LigB subunit of aromatic ring-opening dioxygenase
MAKLVGVINTAHSPFCYMSLDAWEKVKASRPAYRSDVPDESREEMQAKKDRVENGFATLRAKLAEMRPDVLVVYGDDQEELFNFNNFPGIAIHVGESFSGKLSSADRMFGGSDNPPPQATVPGHPKLATAILTGLMSRGFDPAFMMDVTDPEVGMCHAIMRPLESLTGFDIPTVPVMLNAYYAPQLSAKRCYDIGVAVREIIAEFPDDLRVVIVGSGGLWHTPGQQQSWLDEEFDQEGLAFLAKGDIKGWAQRFDTYTPPADDPSQDHTTIRRSITGLPTPGGPQGGTRETCNWIAAAAAIDGTPSEVLDYIPIYSSPVGVSFAWAEL